MANLIIDPTVPQTDAIIVQTRERSSVTNYRARVLPPYEQGKAAKLRLSYPLVIERSGASGMYNCHGLCFASRRTCIPDPNDVMRILIDDGYEEIDQKDVKAGDVVLYYEDGDIHHSGIVVRSNKDTTLPVPTILSKWGHGWEVIHSESYGPYREGSTIKYFRILE